MLKYIPQSKTRIDSKPWKNIAEFFQTLESSNFKS